MTIGHVGGYSVHHAPAAESIAVAEGIETGLSVIQATGIPTWAALSIGGMRKADPATAAIGAGGHHLR